MINGESGKDAAYQSLGSRAKTRCCFLEKEPITI